MSRRNPGIRFHRRPRGVIHDDGIASNGAKCPHGAVHTADKDIRRAAKYLLRFRAFFISGFG